MEETHQENILLFLVFLNKVSASFEVFPFNVVLEFSCQLPKGTESQVQTRELAVRTTFQYGEMQQGSLYAAWQVQLKGQHPVNICVLLFFEEHEEHFQMLLTG